MSKYTFEFIKNKVESYRDGEFELIDVEEFSGCKSKVKVRHKKCNRILTNQNIANFIGLDRGCKFCDSNKLDSQKIKDMIELTEGYCCEDEPKTIREKVKIKHLSCNSVFEMKPADFIYNKHRCPKCNSKVEYTEDIIREKIKNLDSTYSLVNIIKSDNTKPSRQKIVVRHSICNTETTCILHNFINNKQRCKECSKTKLTYIGNSRQVLLIEKYLVDNNITFEREKKFPELKDKRPLRFDFYINFRGKEILIEYDGKQHFTTNKHNKIFTPEKVIETQKRDKLKDDYCKNNGKHLIRFSYKDSDEIIINKLNCIFKSGPGLASQD